MEEPLLKGNGTFAGDFIKERVMVSALADDLRQEIIGVKENEALPLPAISRFSFYLCKI